ncbi:hypothetical protein GKC33_07360 [Lactobacillus salivarius]|uniref:Uncharacterized protein n=2 Tax=Ligilactobacillus salivarius TaxID=1624 RepID=A0A7X2MFB8_9LACO|nr:hypothetical protein [Ligilactobacillus salivarius]
MTNNAFIAILLGCGSYDISSFFEKLDRYEDTVFAEDYEFSYQKLIEKVKEDYGEEYDIDSFNKELDLMAIESALDQAESSDKFEELVWNGLNGCYNASNNFFGFDNEKELREFGEWDKFSKLLPLVAW